MSVRIMHDLESGSLLSALRVIPSPPPPGPPSGCMPCRLRPVAAIHCSQSVDMSLMWAGIVPGVTLQPNRAALAALWLWPT